MSTDTTHPGPELRTVTMHAYRPPAPATGVITRNEVCTASTKAAGYVRHIEIDVSGTDLAGLCAAGQSVGVIAPGDDARGRPYAPRLYSLACPTGGETGDGTVLSTTVKRTIDEHWETGGLFLGVASNYLCDRTVGDEVKLTGPAGKRFVLPARPGEHGYVFFATGTGIAPFRGMALELLRDHPGVPVTLVMGAPYATDLIYHELFEKLDAEHENFRYLTAISRHPGADGSAPMYVQGRITPADERLAAQLADPKTLVYVCGIAGMEMGILRNLAFELGEGIRNSYLTLDEELLDPEVRWDRKMLHRRIKPNKRVFLEVYA